MGSRQGPAPGGTIPGGPDAYHQRLRRGGSREWEPQARAGRGDGGISANPQRRSLVRPAALSEDGGPYRSLGLSGQKEQEAVRGKVPAGQSVMQIGHWAHRETTSGGKVGSGLRCPSDVGSLQRRQRAIAVPAWAKVTLHCRQCCTLGHWWYRPGRRSGGACERRRPARCSGGSVWWGRGASAGPASTTGATSRAEASGGSWRADAALALESLIHTGAMRHRRYLADQ